MTKTTALRTSIDKASSRSRMLNGQSKPQHSVTPVHPLLRLQRSIGNRAVARLIQAKLQRSESGDVCERKAEHTAVQVMRMVEPGRQNDASKIATEASAQRKAIAASAEIGTPPPIIDKVLASPGQPLDAATRAFFEPRFGHDFGKVRVHAGTAAAQSAQEMSARAFTIGNNIVFGSGQLAPETQDGRRLLAHELTHVVQQRTGNVSRQIIQRAKIPYGPLTWADFKAQPPANRNPAEGAGILSAFDIPGIAVSPDTKKTRRKCKIGSSPSTIYEAKLAVDAKAFDGLAPYMDQERSWALDRYKGDGTVYCEGRVDRKNARLFSQCLTDETAERARLLKHEQVHFDITNVMAGKAKASLSTEAAKIRLTAKGCGQEAASDAVLGLYNRPHDDLVDLGRRWQTSKDQAQDDFDTQTGHGAKIAEQNAWEGRIGTGLTDYDPTALPAPPPPSTTTPPAPTRTQPAPPPSRGYSCGGSSGLTGSCTECEKKKLMGQPLQTKLLINESGDVYEQEADRVAARVMRMTETDSRPDHLRSGALVQRRVVKNEPATGQVPTLQRAEAAGEMPASEVVTPKDTGPIIQTRAVAHGDDLIFNRGKYQPTRLERRRNLALQLTHTYRQRDLPFQVQRQTDPAPICNGQAYNPRKICCINGKLVPQSPIEDLEECPDRKQLVGRPNEYDGCSVPWFIRIGEDKDNPAGGTDTAFSDTSIHGIRPQAFVPTLPCDVHDKCYQTCNPDPVARELCDMKLIVDASRVCNNSTEDEQVRERCRKAVEKANYFLVRHGFGEESFEERQRQYCHCCPPPSHKHKKRQMIANTENVRLVKEPKYWANDDFLFARLPKGTTVEVLDKGAGEPFNQTALEYQWWWVRAEGKEGWVMQVLLDDVTGSP